MGRRLLGGTMWPQALQKEKEKRGDQAAHEPVWPVIQKG